MKKILLFLPLLLILFFASTGDARLLDRLQPIVEGDAFVAVDTFIMGTHNRYIATIVRNFDPSVTHELSMMMNEMLAGFDSNELAIVERWVFDRNAKRLGRADRVFVLSTDLDTPIASETFGPPDLLGAIPGSLEEHIWYAVAGEDGWGARILGEFPEPAALTAEKNPVDTERYIAITERQVGGIFFDRNSIRLTEEGVFASILEVFDLDTEFQFGTTVMQLTHQQDFFDAYYSISEYELSFANKAARQLNYTIFGPQNQVIYSVRIARDDWIEGYMNPFIPTLLAVAASHMPEAIAEHLADDLASFREYMRARAEYMQARYEAFQRWVQEQYELEQQLEQEMFEQWIEEQQELERRRSEQQELETEEELAEVP